MGIAALVRRVSRKVTAVAAAAAAVTALSVATAGYAQADNYWGRPGCVDAGVRAWVQKCPVWSASMNRDIWVQVKPAARNGNAGLYLLDGLRARDDLNAWSFDRGNAAETFLDDNITLVMPIGGQSSFYTDWYAPSNTNGQDYTYKWETFLTRELPVYLEQNFGVSRSNNFALGLSMGAIGAGNLAGWHRDQFRGLAMFSGYLNPSAIGMKTAIRLSMLDAGFYNVDSMWGGPFDPAWIRNDPFVNLENFRDMPLYISSASGVPGKFDHPQDLQQHYNTFNGVLLEGLSRASTQVFEAKANALGIRATYSYVPQGIHAFAYWQEELTKARPFILNAMNAY